jgi:hypothetical protein
VSYYSLSFAPAVDYQPQPLSIIRVEPDDSTAPRKAVEVLRAGGVLVFPTAEGYVVGCAATNPAAVRRLSDITGVAPGDLRYLAASRCPLTSRQTRFRWHSRGRPMRCWPWRRAARVSRRRPRPNTSCSSLGIASIWCSMLAPCAAPRPWP